MTFQNKVKDHFKLYETYEITSEVKGGLWQGKVSYPHILIDKKKWDLNLLPEYRDGIKSLMEAEHFKRHMYFHHLNSSQAMCLNFFYPLLHNNNLLLVLNQIDADQDWGNIVKKCFEKKSDLEENKADEMGLTMAFGEPSNFDFFIQTNNGYEITFEIKYTEQEFGRAEKKEGRFQCKYDQKFKVYESLMPKCIVENREQENFLKHYQLMRNLLNLQDNMKHYTVFLIPKNNSRVAKQAEESKKWVSPEFSDNVRVLYWEDLVPSVVDTLENSSLRNYYENDFINRYLNLKMT